MKFNAWLADAVVTDDIPGDLIGDMKHDSDMPEIRSKKALRAYLRSCHACPEAMGAVDEAWRRFKGVPE